MINVPSIEFYTNRTKGQPKIKNARQELGVKIQEFFKESTWWIVNRRKNKRCKEFKYSLDELRSALESCQEYKKCILPYFIKILNNQKNGNN